VFWFAIAMVCVVVFAFILPDYDVGFSLQWANNNIDLEVFSSSQYFCFHTNI
jgi:hypothetical protein